MDCKLYLIMFVGIIYISTITLADGKKKFTLTYSNQLEEPFFTESVELNIVNKRPLIDYMEQASHENSTRFPTFTATFFGSLNGYFINAINGKWGVWDPDQTWWAIWNGTGLIPVGVSLYIPVADDPILFNFTQGWINH